MRRNVVALLLVFVMVFGAMPTVVFAAEDSDYATRGEVCEMLLCAADDYNPLVQKTDILKGYEDGALHEERNVTRSEALVMLGRAFGAIPEVKGNNKLLAFPHEDFTDVPSWAELELADVFASGIVAGKAEGLFAPDDYVTVAEMRLFIQRMYRVFGTNRKDDFSATVGKDFLDHAVLPEGRSISGGLYTDEADVQLVKLMEEISASNPDKNSKAGKIKTLYDNYLNMDARNKLGYDAIKPEMDKVDAAKTIADLIDAEMISAFLQFAVDVDSRDTSKYANYFATISIPIKDMYEGKADAQKAAYLRYITTLFTLSGYAADDAAKAADSVFAFRTEIAEASLSITELYDAEKTYHEYSLDEIDATFKGVDIKKVFGNTGLKNPSRFIVGDVGAMNKVAELLTDDNMGLLKTVVKAAILEGYAGYLDDSFLAAQRTYNAELSGTQGSRSDEIYAMNLVNGALSSYVGELYGNKYTSDQLRADINRMIDELTEAYRDRITNLDWMTDATKEMALRKLNAIGRKIASPDVWPEMALDGMELRSYADGGSLVENMDTISDASILDNYALEGTEVDHSKWTEMPQVINAFYYPLYNDITLPLAILRLPLMYSEDRSYAANLGAIGFVIGHEMSHAFDSSGSQFDEYGNVNNWWTDADAAAFAALCQDVVDYYDGQEAAPGIATNGELTLAENIADLGAIAVILEIASKTDDFDYEAMFEAYTKVWTVFMTREDALNRSMTDVHSPASVRINRVLQSVDKFYEVYDITEGDGMWVAPEDRASIW